MSFRRDLPNDLIMGTQYLVPMDPKDVVLPTDMQASRELMNRAKQVIPGGVNSYARKYDVPLSFKRGAGAKIYDMDGDEYIDYLNAWGAIILGHCNERVNRAARTTMEEQDLFGFGTTELEVEVAEEIQNQIPSADQVLFGITGSEVTARAAHLARAVTGGSKIIKFQGHYHGWYDSYAMNFHSKQEDLGKTDPSTEGLLPETVEQTVVLPFNDVAAIENAIEEHEDDIAGIILEPIAHNMGCVLPKEGYLRELRRICDQHGIILIFDEIITGFRHTMGGVQNIEGVVPDLTTLGKSVANGYPISVLCGKEEYMRQFTTAGGNVSFGGTYNSHATSMAAAKKTLQILDGESFHKEATDQAKRISAAIEDHIEDIGITAQVKQYGTVFLTYFMDGPTDSYQDVLSNDTETYTEYRWEMVDRGIMTVPKDIRRNYLTASHTEEDVQRTIEAAEESLRAISE